MKKCPFCAEEIQNEAIKCRFCGEWFDTEQDLIDKEKDAYKEEIDTDQIIEEEPEEEIAQNAEEKEEEEDEVVSPKKEDKKGVKTMTVGTVTIMAGILLVLAFLGSLYMGRNFIDAIALFIPFAIFIVSGYIYSIQDGNEPDNGLKNKGIKSTILVMSILALLIIHLLKGENIFEAFGGMAFEIAISFLFSALVLFNVLRSVYNLLKPDNKSSFNRNDKLTVGIWLVILIKVFGWF